MTLDIKNRPEFIDQIPATLAIQSNEEKIIITDTLNSSDIIVAEGSNLYFIALLEKGWDETQKLNFHLEGSNSTVNFLCIILGTKEESFPFETVSTHTTTHTNAYYNTRAVMFDKSKVNYKGNLKIEAQAQVTDSYLAHHTLMLSKDAVTNTIPCLEIEADDVKAGHAATIGNVDEDLLYYLKTRGIDKKAAIEILIKGFLETDIATIPNQEIQNLLSQRIARSLKTLRTN